MDEVKKRLKDHYLQLKREHGWSEHEIALTMKSSNAQSRNINRGNKGKFFKRRCANCGKYGHKKADCWDLKNKEENRQESERKVKKDKSHIRCFKCQKMGHYANKCRSGKGSSGSDSHDTFAMMCYELNQDEKYEKEEEENKEESKNPEEEERRVDPGTARNTEEPQGIPHSQSCIREVFPTGITNEWAMSMTEDNLATPRDLRLVQAWKESSKHGQEEKSQNVIKVQLAQEKSHLEHRSSNISNSGKNVVHAQSSVTQEENEIQN